MTHFPNTINKIALNKNIPKPTRLDMSELSVKNSKAYEKIVKTHIKNTKVTDTNLIKLYTILHHTLTYKNLF